MPGGMTGWLPSARIRKPVMVRSWYSVLASIRRTVLSDFFAWASGDSEICVSERAWSRADRSSSMCGTDAARSRSATPRPTPTAVSRVRIQPSRPPPAAKRMPSPRSRSQEAVREGGSGGRTGVSFRSSSVIRCAPDRGPGRRGR